MDNPILKEQEKNLAKVFCIKCSFLYKDDKGTYQCICKPNIIERIEQDSWFYHIIKYVTKEHPMNLNKDNNCPWYEFNTNIKI